MLNRLMHRISTFLILFSFIFSQESKVREIYLEGPANQRSLEMSGLTWYKDELILMPQYINHDEKTIASTDKRGSKSAYTYSKF